MEASPCCRLCEFYPLESNRVQSGLAGDRYSTPSKSMSRVSEEFLESQDKTYWLGQRHSRMTLSAEEEYAKAAKHFCFNGFAALRGLIVMFCSWQERRHLPPGPMHPLVRRCLHSPGSFPLEAHSHSCRRPSCDGFPQYSA